MYNAPTIINIHIFQRWQMFFSLRQLFLSILWAKRPSTVRRQCDRAKNHNGNRFFMLLGQSYEGWWQSLESIRCHMHICSVTTNTVEFYGGLFWSTFDYFHEINRDIKLNRTPVHCLLVWIHTRPIGKNGISTRHLFSCCMKNQWVRITP